MSIIGSIIGGAVTAGGSILSSILGNNTSSANLERAAELNREQSDHDRAENYYLQKKMLDDERDYNSPVKQMERLKSAGLNPNLIYQGLNSNQPTISNSLGATSGPVGQQPAFAPDLGGAAMTAAQIGLINAQKRKTEKEALGQGYQNDILASDSRFRDALNEGTLNLNNVQIALNKSQMSINQEQQDKLRAECRNLDMSAEQITAAIDQTKALVQQIGLDNARKEIENKFIVREKLRALSLISSQIGLNKMSVYQMQQSIANMLLTGESIKLGNAQLGIQNDQLQLNFDSDTEFKEIERTLGVLGPFVKLIAKLFAK